MAENKITDDLYYDKGLKVGQTMYAASKKNFYENVYEKKWLFEGTITEVGYRKATIKSNNDGSTYEASFDSPFFWYMMKGIIFLTKEDIDLIMEAKELQNDEEYKKHCREMFYKVFFEDGKFVID